MDLLVSRILIFSSVITLGFGNSLPVGLADNNIQRPEANPPFVKILGHPLSKFGINDSQQKILPVGWLPDNNLEVELSATEWSWRIRKCGVFAGQVLNCQVRSPFDVLVDFEGFANFTDANANVQINTWYAISQASPPPPRSSAWIPAQKLNLFDFTIPAPIRGFSWNLWCMIEVTNEISASEYSNRPTITFNLQGVEEWIEPGLSLEERTGFINKLPNG